MVYIVASEGEGDRVDELTEALQAAGLEATAARYAELGRVDAEIEGAIRSSSGLVVLGTYATCRSRSARADVRTGMKLDKTVFLLAQQDGWREVLPRELGEFLGEFSPIRDTDPGGIARRVRQTLRKSEAPSRPPQLRHPPGGPARLASWLAFLAAALTVLKAILSLFHGSPPSP